MSEQKLFTVVIPLYNKAASIARALKSVSQQTYRDYDVVIVDDGSIDDGVEIARRFEDEFALRIVSQRNAGVSCARNRGVAEARGRFVALLDADDMWLPFHLANLKSVVDKFPSAKVVSSRTATVLKGRVEVFQDDSGIKAYDIFNEFMRGEPICSSSVAFDRQFFMSTGGYDNHYRFFEDVELYFRMAELIGEFHGSYRVSAYYFHDDAHSATGSGNYTYTDYAHWRFLENRLKNGLASKGMRRCARRLLGQVVYGECLRLHAEKIHSLRELYPFMYKQVLFGALLDIPYGCYICWPMILLRVLIRKLSDRRLCSNVVWGALDVH